MLIIFLRSGESQSLLNTLTSYINIQFSMNPSNSSCVCRWCITWVCASVCMTSLNWRIPTSFLEMERLILKVQESLLLTAFRQTSKTSHPLSLSLSSAVHFRYVVFHPFLDAILVGKIKGCSAEGVHGERGHTKHPWCFALVLFFSGKGYYT